SNRHQMNEVVLCRSYGLKHEAHNAVSYSGLNLIVEHGSEVVRTVFRTPLGVALIDVLRQSNKMLNKGHFALEQQAYNGLQVGSVKHRMTQVYLGQVICHDVYLR